MKTPKLLQQLKSLTSKELDSFAAFLYSPYFNRKEAPIQLFEYLRPYHPTFDHQDLDKDRLVSRFFPEQEDGLKALNQLMNTLARLIEDFWTVEQWRKNDFDRKRGLMKVLELRQEEKAYTKTSKKARLALEKKTARGIPYFRAALQLEHDLFFHPVPFGFPALDDNIHDLMDHLDSFYLMSKLRYSCELLSRRAFLPEEGLIHLLEEAKSLALESTFSSNPLLVLYAQLVKAYSASDLDYDQLLELFEQFKGNQQLMEAREQQSLFRHFINLAYRQMNRSQDKRYTTTMLEWYKYGLSANWVLQNKGLSDITFTNIAITACLVKDFAWAKQFINQYQPYLAVAIRDNALALCMAYWHFHQQQFGKAIDQLIDVKYANQAYMMRGRSLQIRSQYELYTQDLRHYNFLNDQIDAFKRNLYRFKKVGSKRVRAYLNFLSLLRRMARVVLRETPVRASTQSRMLLHLEEKEVIVAGPWLRKKIEEWS